MASVAALHVVLHVNVEGLRPRIVKGRGPSEDDNAAELLTIKLCFHTPALISCLWESGSGLTRSTGDVQCTCTQVDQW